MITRLKEMSKHKLFEAPKYIYTFIYIINDLRIFQQSDFDFKEEYYFTRPLFEIKEQGQIR